MKLVIEIPEDTYQYVINTGTYGHYRFNSAKAIKNGTPLPDNFDLEGLKSDMKALNCGYPYGLDYLLDCLKKRLGITIADKEN
jgi:hypothetical protein